MIDSHCHLADAKFSKDLPDVLARAAAVGVDRIVAIADNFEEADRCRRLAEKYEQIFYTIGVHPHAANEWRMANCALRMKEELQHPKCVAVGEIGLDYHYMHSSKEDQLRAFREQLMIAKELGLPAVIHNRESIDDLTMIIAEVAPPALVLHCCTEEWESVSDLVKRGYLLSFTGMATYPKLQLVRDTITRCPLSQMMVETDAPYLAPEAFRGKRCEPSMVVEIAKLIAQLKGISYEEVDRVTTQNAEKFYGLRVVPSAGIEPATPASEAGG